MKRLLKFLLPLLLGGLLIVACSSDSAQSRKDAINNDQNNTAVALTDLQKAVPTPKFATSQLRQNLVDIITAQANTTQTTSFFFNQGVTDPIMSCPAVGFPIPSTAQLTNPEQKIPDNALTLPQAEVTGVYTGASTGTYVICINAEGQAYAVYWEGFVQTLTGPATWDTAKHQVELTGAPSFDFHEGK